MNKLRSGGNLVLLIGLLAAGWFLGLIFFVASIHDYAELTIDDTLPPTEAIVVLTGGSERLAAGLDLLAANKGKKLFVSGVYPGLNLDRLLAGRHIPKETRDCCIILGHAADNTIGNAEETALWIETEGFHSLRLVTAHYHMPRSLLLFREQLPDVEVVPYAVTPDSVKLSHWWTWPGTSNLLITEYNKYLFALLRTQLKDWLEDLVEALS